MHFAKMQKELDVSMKLTSRAMPQNVDLPEPPSALPSAAATTLIFISSLVRYLMISRLPPFRKSAFEFPKERIPFALVVLTFPLSLKEFWEYAVRTALVEVPSEPAPQPQVGPNEDLRSARQQNNNVVYRCRANLRKKQDHDKETLGK